MKGTENDILMCAAFYAVIRFVASPTVEVGDVVVLYPIPYENLVAGNLVVGRFGVAKFGG